MKNKFKHSWSTFCLTLKIIRRDRKLLFFPPIAGFALIALMFFFLLICGGIAWAVSPELFSNMDKDWLPKMMALDSVWKLAVFPIFYFISSASLCFCNTVYLSEFLQAMRQQPVNWRRGFAFGLGRIKIISLWSLLVAAVWLVLGFIQQQYGIAGIIAVDAATLIWIAVCCFDVICIVISPELETPWAILRRSATTLKKTWGEVVIGALGVCVLYLTLLIGVAVMIFICGLLGAMAGVTNDTSFWLMLALILAVELVFFSFIFLTLAFFQAYRAILYLETFFQSGEKAVPASEPQTAVITEQNHGQKEM